MLPVKEMRESLEKDAADGKVFKDILSFVTKHPVSTAAILGTAAFGPSLILGAARSVVPAYHIVNEEGKRGIMNKQTMLLRQIEQAVKETGKKPEVKAAPKQTGPGYSVITPPLV